MAQTNLNLDKFQGLYPGVPVIAVPGRAAYLDTPAKVVARLNEAMRRRGLGQVTPAHRAEIRPDSLSRMLKTGVTTIADAYKVFDVLDIKPTKLPGEISSGRVTCKRLLETIPSTDGRKFVNSKFGPYKKKVLNQSRAEYERWCAEK